MTHEPNKSASAKADDESIQIPSEALDKGLLVAFANKAQLSSTELHSSVLPGISAALHSQPNVVLKHPMTEDEGSIVRPHSPEIPATSANSRYRFDGEIARGGMGAILKGRDVDLGRDLAAKVLLESHRNKPDVVHRFIEEAQIGGQLQHPGIVPV